MRASSPTTPLIGAIAGAAAVGFVAGVAANMGRKMAVQHMEALAGDWVDVLKAEHRMVEKLFDMLEETPAEQPGKRTMIFAKIKMALSKHAFQEETVVYPAIAERDPGLRASKLNSEHFEIKRMLSEGERMDKKTPVFMALAKRLRGVIEIHVREEEEKIFPELRGRQSDEEAAELTHRMHKEGMRLV